MRFLQANFYERQYATQVAPWRIHPFFRRRALHFKPSYHFRGRYAPISPYSSFGDILPLEKKPGFFARLFGKKHPTETSEAIALHKSFKATMRGPDRISVND